MLLHWKRNPFVLMAVLLVLWGSFAAMSKWALHGLESWQLQFFMFAIAMLSMLFLLPVGGHSQQLMQISKKSIIQLSLIGFVSYLYYVFYTTALKFVPAIEASMLNYLFPITIVLFAIWLSRERLTLSIGLLILSGFIGTYIILTDGHLFDFRLTNAWGDLLAIGAAVLWGLFSTLGKTNDSPLFVSVFIYVAVSFICSLISMFLFSEWVFPDWTVLAGIGWLSMSNVVLSYFIWIQALKVSSSALVSSLSFITPFVTLIFIVAVLGEEISLYQLMGFIWILGSVYAHSRLERKQIVEK